MFLQCSPFEERPEEDRYDSELLKSITGIPWDPQAIREEPAIAAPREPIIASPSGEALVQPPAIDDKKRKLRRLYIAKKDLEKFGYTAGCPACDATQIGKRSFRHPAHQQVSRQT